MVCVDSAGEHVHRRRWGNTQGIPISCGCLCHNFSRCCRKSSRTDEGCSQIGDFGTAVTLEQWDDEVPPCCCTNEPSYCVHRQCPENGLDSRVQPRLLYSVSVWTHWAPVHVSITLFTRPAPQLLHVPACVQDGDPMYLAPEMLRGRPGASPVAHRWGCHRAFDSVVM